MQAFISGGTPPQPAALEPLKITASKHKPAFHLYTSIIQTPVSLLFLMPSPPSFLLAFFLLSLRSHFRNHWKWDMVECD